MNQIGQTRAAVSVHVLPEFRRQGIGKTLIRAVAQRMRDTGITSLEAVTTTRELAGQALTARLLGRPITEACVQELPVGDVNHAILRSWLSRGDEVGVQLETFQGRYDEMDLSSVARLKAAVRAEYGRVEKNQPPEQFLAKLQQEESRLEGRPDERWVSCARTSSREVVGYNEAILGAELPTLLEETETAVSESMRGRGLGRLIKARLLTDVLESRPSIRLIRTINLTRATGMLKTNEQVGYTVSHHYTRWEIPAESLFEYLVPAWSRVSHDHDSSTSIRIPRRDAAGPHCGDAAGQLAGSTGHSGRKGGSRAPPGRDVESWFAQRSWRSCSSSCGYPELVRR